MRTFFSRLSDVLWRRSRDARLDEEVNRLPERPDYIETQYRVLKSRTLARRVIERLDLARLPELNGGVLPAAERGTAHEDASGKAPPHVVDAFQQRLRVSPGKGTRLVEVSFESQDSALAPLVSNTS